MKTNHKKTLTLGDLIESVYSACNHRRARAIVRFAVIARIVVFRTFEIVDAKLEKHR